MIGAIIGDIVGSVYERHSVKTTDFPLFGHRSRFTDDTVLTVATADSILHGTHYGQNYREYYRRFPHAGYGGRFIEWASSSSMRPYNSYGNGSAMRVSPVAYAIDTLEEVLLQARMSAEVTHNHPEGIKGAQAVAAVAFLARKGEGKEHIREYVTQSFGYDLTEPIASIRTWYRFDVSCRGSVPQAITAFLESHDFEDAIRLAVSIGGDSDTIACIAGGIAQAFYGEVPSAMEEKALFLLDPVLREVVDVFRKSYKC